MNPNRNLWFKWSLCVEEVKRGVPVSVCRFVLWFEPVFHGAVWENVSKFKKLWIQKSTVRF